MNSLVSIAKATRLSYTLVHYICLRHILETMQTSFPQTVVSRNIAKAVKSHDSFKEKEAAIRLITKDDVLN